MRVPVYSGETNARPVDRTDVTVGRDRAGARSGSRSASGASTKARSAIRGCGTTRSGSSTRPVDPQEHVDVERARTPPHACARARLRPRPRARRASRSCGVEVGVDRDDRVEVVVLVGPADRVRSRRPATRPTTVTPRPRRELVDRELQVRRAGRRGSSRCRGTRASSARGPTSLLDADADVVEHRRGPADAACAP